VARNRRLAITRSSRGDQQRPQLPIDIEVAQVRADQLEGLGLARRQVLPDGSGTEYPHLGTQVAGCPTEVNDEMPVPRRGHWDPAGRARLVATEVPEASSVAVEVKVRSVKQLHVCGDVESDLYNLPGAQLSQVVVNKIHI